MKKDIYIIDTTLRDGEQAPGVSFSLEEKLEIACLLDEVGVDEAEIGTPAMGTREVQDMRTIVNSGFSFRCLAWCRALTTDLDRAIETGIDRVSISFPVSDIQLKAMGRDREWIFTELPKLMNYALDHFNYVAIGAQDACRADGYFLDEFVALAQKYGARRVRLADTVGGHTPVLTSELFRKFSEAYPELDLEFHPHNDLGMATANAITAFQSGATSVDVTVNGLGERAGNAALEEVIVAMNQHNLGKKYNLSGLSELSHRVAEFSGRSIWTSKPIVGDAAFTHESGVHVRSLMKDPLSYQLFDGSTVGKETSFVFGKHSGSSSLMDFFRKKGISLNAVQATSMMMAVKEMAAQSKQLVNSGDLLSIYQQLSGS